MNPELGGCSRRSRNLSSSFAQSSLNHLFLLIGKLLRQLQIAFRLAGRWLVHKPALIHRQKFGFADDNGPLDDVLQFANISWPGVGLQEAHGLVVYASYFLPEFPGIA